MATRTQGLVLGCFFAVAAGAFLIIAGFLLLRGPWSGDSLTFTDGDKIGLVVLEGPINESRYLVEEIDANRRDSSVRAVVLRINSPGGGVAPSQEIYEALLRLREEKPLVASLGGLAASGAFYAAIAADTIVASPGSLVGSIGVIMMYPTTHELMEKIGVEWHVYKSGRLKDMGSFVREPTEEDEEVFDSIIADVYDQFLTAVATERNLDRELAATLADGRVYSGRQALDVGLVDRLGDLYRAVDIAASLAGMPPEPTVVRKTRPRPFFFEVLDRFFREGTQALWGPQLEYRFR